ncbi:MAG: BlaI/MecI/CopY family transcriptional regulator [Sedimentisphaerales bacterium]|nr:BlaI/MecI/CopY family transcriptional regulator [Sedimentisphaerales bacterium]
MNRSAKISEAEWEVMKVLWKDSPLATNDIVEILLKKTSWKRETIRTLINRLVKKKILSFEKKGRQFHYFPMFGEAECIREETKSFLKRIRPSAIEPMLAAFVEKQQLSAEQIARLRQILDGKDPNVKPKKS